MVSIVSIGKKISEDSAPIIAFSISCLLFPPFERLPTLNQVALTMQVYFGTHFFGNGRVRSCALEPRPNAVAHMIITGRALRPVRLVCFLMLVLFWWKNKLKYNSKLIYATLASNLLQTVSRPFLNGVNLSSSLVVIGKWFCKSLVTQNHRL